jgi:hypothetical protein
LTASKLTFTAPATGTGHATDLAVMLGLSGQDPEYIPVDNIDGIIKTIKEHQQIKLGDEFLFRLIPLRNCFNKDSSVSLKRNDFCLHQLC